MYECVCCLLFVSEYYNYFPCIYNTGLLSRRDWLVLFGL